MNILRAFAKHLGLGSESWAAWLALIGGAFGCALTPEQADTFRALTQREPPSKRPRELWLAVGRRGGKDYVAVRIAAYLALFHRWTLAPGEVGVVVLLAVDREQARVAFRYMRGLFDVSPTLAAEVETTLSDRIVLRNGIEIVIGTSDYASVRGRTIVAALLDEFAFWPGEQATEVLRALRPGMATQPDALLTVISSVYSQHGPLFETYRRYYGKDDAQVLFARATSRQMNPTLSEAFVEEELARDPVAAAAEYLSEFRGDLEGFLSLPLLDSATRTGPLELPHRAQLPNGTPIVYRMGLDVSGGRNDATAAAIAHRDGERVVLDAVRHWPSPHDPVQVAREVRAFAAEYGLSHASADQYAAELSVAIYREAGLTLEAAEANRSEAYLQLLPLFTSGRIEIPDHARLRQELLALERRTGRSGKDAVDHQPHGHDDVANAAALAAFAIARHAPLSAEQLLAGLQAGIQITTAWDDYIDPSIPYQKVDWRRDPF